MRLPFLDRRKETRRLAAALGSRESTLAIVYGRRRCGKSRLLQEVVGTRRAVYFLADQREERLQRAIAEIAPFVKGRKVHLALWLKRKPRASAGATVVVPDDVLGVVR